MTIETRTIDYTLDDNVYEALIAKDKDLTGPRPGVMVCHAWGGRKSHEEMAAKRLADLGYVGFAADVYGKGVRGDTIEENQALMTPLIEDREGLQARLRAGLSALAADPAVDEKKLAVVGYCFGGLCSLDMARTNAPVLGCAAFNAVIGQPGVPGGEPIKPKVIAYQGYEDPMADKEAQRGFADEMTERQADWQLHLFGGVKHAFTNPDADNDELGLKYNALADARSWSSFTRFLDNLFA